MKKLLMFALIMLIPIFAKDTLVFGAITTQKVTKVKAELDPFIQYLEKELNKKIVFKTGKDYEDTISKFNNGEFDFGYIGPSPYVIATKKENNLNIIAGIETHNKPYFYGVIVTSKDNKDINSVKDLKNKSFAFGSHESTLSYYMPAYTLMENGVLDTLTKKDFLGKHDKVALAVIQGKYDAGGIKESVANKYLSKLKIISTSEPVYDFMIVANKKLDKDIQESIKKALLKLKNKEILNSIKEGTTGFFDTKEANYNSLKHIMEKVDTHFK